MRNGGKTWTAGTEPFAFLYSEDLAHTRIPCRGYDIKVYTADQISFRISKGFSWKDR